MGGGVVCATQAASQSSFERFFFLLQQRQHKNENVSLKCKNGRTFLALEDQTALFISFRRLLTCKKRVFIYIFKHGIHLDCRTLREPI